eukprot:Nk52_evm29s628 gene=Nk52_evmTU29s628
MADVQPYMSKPDSSAEKDEKPEGPPEGEWSRKKKILVWGGLCLGVVIIVLIVLLIVFLSDSDDDSSGNLRNSRSAGAPVSGVTGWFAAQNAPYLSTDQNKIDPDGNVYPDQGFLLGLGNARLVLPHVRAIYQTAEDAELDMAISSGLGGENHYSGMFSNSPEIQTWRQKWFDKGDNMWIIVVENTVMTYSMKLDEEALNHQSGAFKSAVKALPIQLASSGAQAQYDALFQKFGTLVQNNIQYGGMIQAVLYFNATANPELAYDFVTLQNQAVDCFNATLSQSPDASKYDDIFDVEILIKGGKIEYCSNDHCDLTAWANSVLEAKGSTKIASKYVNILELFSKDANEYTTFQSALANYYLKAQFANSDSSTSAQTSGSSDGCRPWAGAPTCSGNGICQGGKCKCNNKTYTGDYCDVFTCKGGGFSLFGGVCNGNGKCCSGAIKGCKNPYNWPINSNRCSCNDGYTGVLCETKVCSKAHIIFGKVCNGHGTCVGLNNCACKDGWTGDKCETPPCYPSGSVSGLLGTLFKSPCGGNGNCVLGKCQCNDGLVGEFCSDHLCSKKGLFGKVCNGHGLCAGPNMCQCSGGWGGSQCNSTTGMCLTCDMPPCKKSGSWLAKECSGNGYCWTDQSGSSCRCKPGYEGRYCEKAMCPKALLSGNMCSGNGVCVQDQTTKNYQCECKNNYHGSTLLKCDLKPCYSSGLPWAKSCNGNGVCNNGKCQCFSEYGGDYCQNRLCKANLFGTVCSGNGKCVGVDKCQCEGGYHGPNCSLPPCKAKGGLLSFLSRKCSGHGECQADTGKCKCDNGYSGTYCTDQDCKKEFFNLFGPVCNGHGDCVGKDQCECKDGYHGEASSYASCKASDGCYKDCKYKPCYAGTSWFHSKCSGHGVCYENQCHCNNGYGGQFCNDHMCKNPFPWNIFKSACMGRGQCVGPNKCVCSGYWHGDNCELDGCTPVKGAAKCGGHGHCNRDIGQCTCDKGYSGKYCTEHLCERKWNGLGAICSGQGECVAKNTCVCANGFGGDKCEIRMPEFHTIKGYCAGNGKVVPDMSTEMVVKDEDMPVESRIHTEIKGVCKCNPGFAGTNCQCMSTNDVECSGNGNCDGRKGCICKAGWSGPSCAHKVCPKGGALLAKGQDCSGNGQCSAGVCKCKSGYYGLACEFKSCQLASRMFDPVCSGNGKCKKDGTCKCNNGYSGKYCALKACQTDIHQQACYGNGKCIGENKCECKEGYGGSDCKCPSTTKDEYCSGAGKCEWLFGHHCKCNKHYSGPKCEKYDCYKAMKAMHGSECSGNGKCQRNYWAEYSCKCREGWTGADCSQEAECLVGENGKLCSNNGVCYKGQCQCHPGWTGETCDARTCSKKCHEKGYKCLENGVCECPEGKFGRDCECTRKVYAPPMHPEAKLPLGYCMVGQLHGKPVCGHAVAQYYCNLMHPDKKVTALSVSKFGQNRGQQPETASFNLNDERSFGLCPTNHAFDKNVQCNSLSYVICEACPPEDDAIEIRLNNQHTFAPIPK